MASGMFEAVVSGKCMGHFASVEQFGEWLVRGKNSPIHGMKAAAPSSRTGFPIPILLIMSSKAIVARALREYAERRGLHDRNDCNARKWKLLYGKSKLKVRELPSDTFALFVRTNTPLGAPLSEDLYPEFRKMELLKADLKAFVRLGGATLWHLLYEFCCFLDSMAQRGDARPLSDFQLYCFCAFARMIEACILKRAQRPAQARAIRNKVVTGIAMCFLSRDRIERIGSAIMRAQISYLEVFNNRK